jgi:hypothetical protein
MSARAKDIPPIPENKSILFSFNIFGSFTDKKHYKLTDDTKNNTKWNHAFCPD